MFKKLLLLLLPIASFAVFVLMLQILYVLPQVGGTAFIFAFGCIPLCWTCSTACGYHEVKRKRVTFPKSVSASKIFLFVSFFAILASGVALFAGRDIGLLLSAFFVLFCSAICCLVSVFITFFTIIRSQQDFYSWVIFMTQIFWAVASFYIYFLIGELELIH